MWTIWWDISQEMTEHRVADYNMGVAITEIIWEGPQHQLYLPYITTTIQAVSSLTNLNSCKKSTT